MASVVPEPLIVIVGETASGKSALAMELAKQFNGEIIAADSRTVYIGMDIGTAKPSKEDQKRVPHHLLDIVEPGQKYNVARFKTDALYAIDDITSRGKLPIMVGGTGLYVDSVIFDYDFDRKTMKPLRKNTLVMGIKKDKAELEEIIAKRIEAMLRNGLIEEIIQIGKKYGWDNEAMKGNSYSAFADYINGIETLDDATQKAIRDDRLLAKRQRTWFKRNKSIHWADNPSSAVEITTTFLNNLRA